MKKYLFLILVSLQTVNAAAQWEPDTRLTYDLAISNTSWNNAWCIASNGNTVHVVWYDNRDGNFEIYYKCSRDGGLNWETDTRLSNAFGSSSDPSISVSGLTVSVAWTDGRDGNKEIYYKRSTDGGINWEPDIRLTNNSATSQDASVLVTGSLVNIVWRDYRNGTDPNIYYKRSTNGGINWEADVRLTTGPAGSFVPCISSSGPILHIVWSDNRHLNYETYYKRSLDGGITWGEDTRLTINSFYNSVDPSLSVNGSAVHVVWYAYRGDDEDIYYKNSTDGGISWSKDIRLTNDSAWRRNPSISVIGLVVHLVWLDGRDGNSEIYYKRSIDGGINWGLDTRLTSSPASSLFPSISVSGKLVHVVWYDERDGNQEIYYKRDPTSNVIRIININTEIPEHFKMYQNYPNPFNPTTKIKFQVAKLGNTKLVFFDALGREIETLVNEQLKPGTYEVEFDGHNVSSGIYFYKLETEYFVDTKRMILIK